jgi:hypothetical protein
MIYRRKNDWALTPQELKAAMVQIQLNHLHSIQLDMIDEVVEKSDMSEAKELIQYIMEKK